MIAAVNGAWQGPRAAEVRMLPSDLPVTALPAVEYDDVRKAVPYGIVVVVTDEGVRFLLQYRGDPDEITIDDEVGIAVDRFGVPNADSRPD